MTLIPERASLLPVAPASGLSKFPESRCRMAGSVFVYTSLVKFTFVCPVWRLTEHAGLNVHNLEGRGGGGAEAVSWAAAETESVSRAANARSVLMGAFLSGWLRSSGIRLESLRHSQVGTCAARSITHEQTEQGRSHVSSVSLRFSRLLKRFNYPESRRQKGRRP